LARIRKERNQRTGKLLKYAKRFYNFGTSVVKMALYRNLAKDDPLSQGYIAFPSGLDDEYFRQLTAERRTPEKRHGFIVYRWTKDETQANEGLDTMLYAEAASIKYGVRGLPDAIWARIEAERETPPAEAQRELFDTPLFNDPIPSGEPQTPRPAARTAPKPASGPRFRQRLSSQMD
jgi:phage terminase large subunit GpA-like protein